MDDMKLRQAHEKLYALIPEVPFKCIEGCKDCCGPVICSPWEKSLQPDIEESKTMYCAYAGVNGCEGCLIHKDRPLMCRLFGTNAKMKCPHFDYTPQLSEEEVRSIIKQYSKLVGPIPLMTKGCSAELEKSVVRAATKNRPEEFEKSVAQQAGKK